MHGIDSSKGHLMSVCGELDGSRSRAHLESSLAKQGGAQANVLVLGSSTRAVAASAYGLAA